jgi:hypothetical protein
MSPTLSIALFSALDLAIVVGLALVCVVPFRLGRRQDSTSSSLRAASSRSRSVMPPAEWVVQRNVTFL